MRLLRFLLLELVARDIPFSDDGDSFLIAAAISEEEGTLLLSLLSP
jgi:hypothetical protein